MFLNELTFYIFSLSLFSENAKRKRRRPNVRMHPIAIQMTIYKCLLLLKNSIYHNSSYSSPFYDFFCVCMYMKDEWDFRPAYNVVIVGSKHS